jgi:hypothetical protein
VWWPLPQLIAVNKVCSRLAVSGRWATARNRADRGSQSCLLTQTTGEKTTVLLIKYQHQDWRSNSRTTKTEIAWFLDQKFLFFYSFIYLFYFFSFSNYVFFFVFFLLLFFSLFSFLLWWYNFTATHQTSTTGLDSEGMTSELLRLKLYFIWTCDFFSFLLFSFSPFFFLFALSL